MTCWHNRFMDVATLVSTWSKDPSTKVGAAIIDPTRKSIISTGFNGFPREVADSYNLYKNKDEKYPRIVHAEMNAISEAAAQGTKLMGMSIYVTHPPCPDCTGIIIQTGIREIYFPKQDNNSSFAFRWGCAFSTSKEMMDQAGVRYSEIDYDLYE